MGGEVWLESMVGRIPVFILMIFLSPFVKAQNGRYLDTIGRRNMIKINAAALGISALSVQYERKVEQYITASIGIIKRFDRPIFNYLDRRDESPLRNIEMSSIAVTPEVKFYFRDEVFNGLYLGPFVRFRNDKIRFDYKINDFGERGVASFRLEDKVLHIGMLLGYQLKMTKDIYVDFWLLGIGLRYNQIAGNGEINVDPINGYRYRNLFNTLNGVFNKEFVYAIEDRTFTYAGESWRAAYRGAGVCIGLRF